MRKISKRIAEAFLQGRALKVDNTETDGKAVWLFGNLIAVKFGTDSIAMTLAGHPTPTTRERLNGICEVMFGQRPFAQRMTVQHYNGLAIDPRETVEVYVPGLSVHISDRRIHSYV